MGMKWRGLRRRCGRRCSEIRIKTITLHTHYTLNMSSHTEVERVEMMVRKALFRNKDQNNYAPHSLYTLHVITHIHTLRWRGLRRWCGRRCSEIRIKIIKLHTHYILNMSSQANTLISCWLRTESISPI